MYLQIYKNRNQAHDAIYGKDNQNKNSIAAAIVQTDKALRREQYWDKHNICKRCYMVLPKSGKCNCQD